MVSQDLHDKVKAELLKVQFRVGPPDDLPVSVEYGIASLRWSVMMATSPLTIETAATSQFKERTDHLTHAIALLHQSTGSPTGREPYGDGASIVVRAGESPVHGEGRQVVRPPTAARYA